MSRSVWWSFKAAKTDLADTWMLFGRLLSCKQKPAFLQLSCTSLQVSALSRSSSQKQAAALWHSSVYGKARLTSRVFVTCRLVSRNWENNDIEFTFLFVFSSFFVSVLGRSCCMTGPSRIYRLIKKRELRHGSQTPGKQTPGRHLAVWQRMQINCPVSQSKYATSKCQFLGDSTCIIDEVGGPFGLGVQRHGTKQVVGYPNDTDSGNLKCM